MTGIASLRVGETVPVCLQIVDGVTNQYPQAIVRDDQGNLLTTLDLSHEANGLYVPGSPYSMPDEIFIKVTYVVYSDAGHTTESTVYLRDTDTFIATNPLLANDARLDHLDADISSRSSHAAPDLSNLDVAVSTRGPISEYAIQLAAIQADLDNPGQYKADVSNLDVAVSSRSSHSVADIWSYASRTLTSFGSLVADIWAHVSRTLTAGTRDSEIDAIKAKTDNLKDAWNDPSVGEIDAELTAAHGGGSWLGGGDGSFYYVDGAITADIVEDELTVDIIEDELTINVAEKPIDDITVDIIEDDVTIEINEETFSTNICEEQSC